MKAKSMLTKSLWCLLFLLPIAVCPAAAGKIIYVDDDAVGLNDGSSWNNAYTFLQDALYDAETSEKPVEIRVAQGIYTPDENSISPDGTGNRGAMFQLINNVSIMGGYAGFVEVNPNARDIEAYETILSGDLSGNDIDVNDPCDLRDAPNRYDNSWNVVTGSYTDTTAVLDGFTIIGGDVWVISYGSANAGGAGMFISSGRPTLIDCTFTGNVTQNSGGGMLLSNNSNPTLIKCIFTRNYALSGGGIFSSGSSPTLINCIFNDNFVPNRGGGMFNFGGNPILTNCTFSRNSAFRQYSKSDALGGGMYNENGNPVLNNCMFSENSASFAAGGMFNKDCKTVLNMCEFVGNIASSYSGAVSNSGQLIAKGCAFKKNYPGAVEAGIENGTIFTDCIFSGNSSRSDGGAVRVFEATFNHCIFAGNRASGDHSTGGAVYGFSPLKFNNCTFSNNWADSWRAIYSHGITYVNNCIFWGSEDQIRTNNFRQFQFVDYSDIQGGWTWPDEGNIDADPCFVDPGYWADADDPNVAVEPNDPNAVWVDGDYHLKSQVGRWDPNSQSWVQDDVTSPCIDAGDPNSPIGHEPFPNGSIINMGAYGGTVEASKSYILSKIIYVDDDAVGTNDGSSWLNAYTFLQDALANAETAEKPVEIRVAQGVYKPNQGAGNSIIRFQLVNGVTLLGGYAGLTEPDPDIRDVENYETILSGDLNGDDIDVNNPKELFNEPTRSDNCSRIVLGSHTDRTAVLDGFTITGGRVRVFGAVIDSPTGVGGGMKNYSGSPTINNCTFIGNSAEGSGGGMLNDDGSDPILTNCKFIKNYAKRGGGVDSGNSNPIFINCTFTNNYADDGAGMSVYYSETTQTIPIELIDCTFEDNNAKSSGGGLIIYSGDSVLTNCVFIGNSASQGGGMYNNSGIPNLSNCLFIRNNAQVTGGGLDSSEEANPLLIKCIFIDNSSTSGGGIAGSNSIYNCIMSGNTAVNDGGAIYGWGEVINCTVIGNKAGRNGGGICTQGIAALTNSIFHKNDAQAGNEIYLDLLYIPPGRSGTVKKIPSVVSISYSNIWGGEENIPIETDCTLAWESGNIDVDPLFVEPGHWDSNGTPDDSSDDIWVVGDYHLKSQAGRWDPASESWIVDDVTSPCIDAGDPNSPIGQEPFPHGGIINMGAYGGTSEASKSLTTIGGRY
jgi:parallel beta-helix repeat protein